MSIYHDEVEIEDFEYDEDDEMYYYPCPCGDRFQITKVFKELRLSKYYLFIILEPKYIFWRELVEANRRPQKPIKQKQKYLIFKPCYLTITYLNLYVGNIFF